MKPAEWKLRAHGPIEVLAENLWHVTGALPGMTLKRVMTVARRTDGDLVIHNAIVMDEPSMERLVAFGRPAYLVVPNAWHRLDAPAYAARFPEMKVLAPRGGRAKVEDVVRVDGTFEDLPADDTIRLEMLRGLGDAEGVLFVRSADGVTVVLTDAVFNMDARSDWTGWAFTTVFGSAPGPRVSRLFRLLAVKERRAFREELERLASTPDLTRLIVAHEKVASGADAAAVLREAATYV